MPVIAVRHTVPPSAEIEEQIEVVFSGQIKHGSKALFRQRSGTRPVGVYATCLAERRCG